MTKKASKKEPSVARHLIQRLSLSLFHTLSHYLSHPEGESDWGAPLGAAPGPGARKRPCGLEGGEIGECVSLLLTYNHVVPLHGVVREGRQPLRELPSSPRLKRVVSCCVCMFTGAGKRNTVSLPSRSPSQPSPPPLYPVYTWPSPNRPSPTPSPFPNVLWVAKILSRPMNQRLCNGQPCSPVVFLTCRLNPVMRITDTHCLSEEKEMDAWRPPALPRSLHTSGITSNQTLCCRAYSSRSWSVPGAFV